jgi:catechol 2,3-dioxygenase-like lactoylglutathione lyase family enzyme
MRLLRAATLTVPDPDAALADYVRWLGYVPAERGIVGDHLAASWGAPDSAGRAYAVAQPASGAPIFLRFVEGQTQADYRPLRTYGWAAIEICVQDTLAVARHLAGSPFEMIGPPRELDGMPQIFPMQVKGPSGEIVYLTEIRGDLPDCDLPRAASPIDCLFIAVLACSDLGASIDWFARTLGISAGPPVAITYTMLAKAFDLPIEQKHRIAAGMHGRDCFLEFDQYPPQTTKRPQAAGSLPPGVALVTLSIPSIDAIDGDWIAPPRPVSGAIYDNRRTGSLLAPDGTIVEIVEIAA